MSLRKKIMAWGEKEWRNGGCLYQELNYKRKGRREVDVNTNERTEKPCVTEKKG
jgi:hypothetical protein